MRSSSRYDPLPNTAAAPRPLVIPLDPPAAAQVAAYEALLRTTPDGRAKADAAELGAEVGLAKFKAGIDEISGIRREVASRPARPPPPSGTPSRTLPPADRDGCPRTP